MKKFPYKAASSNKAPLDGNASIGEKQLLGISFKKFLTFKCNKLFVGPVSAALNIIEPRLSSGPQATYLTVAKPH